MAPNSLSPPSFWQISHRRGIDDVVTEDYLGEFEINNGHVLSEIPGLLHIRPMLRSSTSFGVLRILVLGRPAY